MRQNQSSITAENNALLRAYETLRPEDERICHDPYAVYFLPERFLTMKDQKGRMEQTISEWEANFPGVCNAIIVRTRFIDDCLFQAIESGIRQLVILGAGYDTRAFRYDALKDEVMVFELDYPATQKAKLDRIKQFARDDMAHVRFIPIDFDEEEPEAKLLASGYSKKVKTLFIWEGVTYYLPPVAVDRTLHFINSNSPEDSSVVFDYFPESVADGTTTLTEALALREGLKRIGEEILFGIEPAQFDDFMRERGLKVAKNLISSEYLKICFKESYRNRKVSEMFLFSQV